MSVDERDVGNHFRATADIRAVIAGDTSTPEPTAAASSFLIKGTNDDSWEALDG